MAELRWILLGLGALAIGVIWWWSTRRSGQAPGNSELRESTVVPTPTLAPVTADISAAAGPSLESWTPPSEPRPWGVSPLEPLSIRTADFDSVPDFDEPMMVQGNTLDEVFDLGPAAPLPDSSPDLLSADERAPASDPPPAPPAAVVPQAAPTLQPYGPAQLSRLRPSIESSDRAAAAEPQATNASERQKIVTVRVCAAGDDRWTGATLMSTLEVHGLAFGRYQVYHRKHNDGRSVFCVASLIEPGTFDIASMPNDEFRGVSMFAVLPGPLDPLQTVDALLATARDLARELVGTVQDGKGMPFSPQRVAALREDVARFQAQLT